MKRPFLAAVLATACLVGGVHAEPAPPAGPDPARLALAYQLVEAIGGEATLRNQMAATMGAMSKLLRDSMPKTQSGVGEVIFKYIADEQMKTLPYLIEDMVEVYATTLTTQELTDFLAWQKSPSGQSIAAKAPVLAQAIIGRQLPRVRAMQAGLMKTVIEKACEEAHCTPADREAVTRALQRAMPQSQS